ncbi:acyl--CoA ligase [Roseomonas aeriglobus]|nr:acyl--CoA ligase [Roseomonas aeriglobus]
MTHNGLLHDGLAYGARRDPDKVFGSVDGDVVRYGELARWSDGVAAHLQDRGVQAGDTVALAGGNSLAWMAAAFAILKCGGIIVPVNDRYVADEVDYLIGFTEPRVVMADDARRAIVAQTRCDVPVIALEALETFRDGPPLGWREVRTSSDAVAMVIFTSGSTARPKGAMMTHGNYLAKFLEMMLLDTRLGPDTRALMPLGLHSSPGLPWGILFTATLGATLYVTKKYRADETLATLRDARVTFFIGAPMIFDQIAKLPDFAAADLSALRFARCGGATLNPATAAAWRAKGVVVRGLYGMTEMGGGSLIASEEEALVAPDSCGRGLTFTRFRIVRPDGGDCAPGEPGDILLRGPGMMAGYWRDPEATAATIIDGWLHTGDVGAVDEDGYFRFVDRSKEIIKSGGFNISPTEIEAVLVEIDGVIEAAVFAVGDDKFGEVPFASLCVSAEIEPGHVIERCRGKLAAFKLPRYVLVDRAPLPRLANQKLDRRTLKALFADPARRPSRID